MALTKLTDIRKSLSAEVNNLKVSGITTFTGSVSIGGTLTYQDVTNVDSVGIITAQAGINVSGGQLDVGSNIKLGNAGVITATSFVGSGANLTGVLSDIVEDTSPQLGGNLDCNNKNISLNDSTGGTNNRIKIGTNDDLQLWHNSSTGNSNISNYNGDLYIQGNNGSGTAVNQIAVKSNAAVELNYQGNKKFETGADRVNITGHIFITDGSRIYLSNGFGNGHATIRNEAGNTAGNMVFTTRTAGGSDTSRAMFTTDGHFIPYANNTYDLGNTATRWRNAYVNDMHFSNEGSSNSIDGTWGDWTLQEGENKIFMINNRTGKKYSLKMEEEE